MTLNPIEIAKGVIALYFIVITVSIPFGALNSVPLAVPFIGQIFAQFVIVAVSYVTIYGLFLLLFLLSWFVFLRWVDNAFAQLAIRTDFQGWLYGIVYWITSKLTGRGGGNSAPQYR